MTEKPPSDDSEFASFDDLPKRVKQSQWSWWRQPVALVLVCAVLGAIAIVLLLNRPRTISQQPVTLLASTTAQGDADPVLLTYGATDLRLSDLNVPSGLSNLQAGEIVCLQVQSGTLDGTPKFNLIALERC